MEGMVQAVKPFPLLMGAKGSPNQLVLNSIFLKDQPIGNISYAEVERLRQQKTVAQAIPLGFGDNYRGFRLIGTEKELFDLKLLGAKQEPAKYVEHDNDRDVTAGIIRPMGYAASMQLAASLLDSVSQRYCGKFIEKASSIKSRALQKT